MSINYEYINSEVVYKALKQKEESDNVLKTRIIVKVEVAWIKPGTYFAMIGGYFNKGE